MRHEVTDLVQGVVEEGVHAGVFSVPDPHAATVAMLRVMDVSPWYNPAGAMSPEDLAESFRSLILAMLGASRPPSPTDKAGAR